MSLQNVSQRGDEYHTPDYVVEILIPYLKKTDIKTIWCPADKEHSEYVKVLRMEGFKVIHSHIDNKYIRIRQCSRIGKCVVRRNKCTC